VTPADPASGPTWDCHVHVFANQARLHGPAAYVPSPAEVDALAAHLKAHAIDRSVLVQPSPYGTDNSCLLAALACLGPCHRAVIAVPPDCDPRRLAGLRDRGVRGLRLNPMGRIASPDGDVRATISTLAHLAADADLAIEVCFAPGALIGLLDTLLASPARIVLPHFGPLLDPAADGGSREALARLLAGGRVWVKASGLDRFPAAERPTRLADAATFLRQRGRDRVVWGSDWPHTPFHAGHPVGPDAAPRPHRRVDTEAARSSIAAAFGAGLWQAATTGNPEALYG